MANSTLTTVGMVTGILCLAIAVFTPNNVVREQVGVHETDQGPREYTIAVPKDYDGVAPAPLVMVVGDTQVEPEIADQALVVRISASDDPIADEGVARDLAHFVQSGYNVQHDHMLMATLAQNAPRLQTVSLARID